MNRAWLLKELRTRPRGGKSTQRLPGMDLATHCGAQAGGGCHAGKCGHIQDLYLIGLTTEKQINVIFV